MDAGLYESLITRRLDELLAEDALLHADIAAVDPSEQPYVLGRHLGEVVTRRLKREKSSEGRVELINRLVDLLDDAGRLDGVSDVVPAERGADPSGLCPDRSGRSDRLSPR